jgi:RNA polymerase sigma-70 factor (ECF subfamily)
MSVTRWVQSAVERCLAAWPMVSLDPGRFTAELERRASGLEAKDRDALHVTDLYLAWACAEGDGAALAEFERHVMPKIHKTFDRLAPKGWQRSDAAQQLRTRLFVARPDAAASITTYSGRGSLVQWTRTVATRMLLDLKRRDEALVSINDALQSRLRAEGLNIERAAIGGEVVPLFKTALSKALAALSARERNLLKLHYVDGLSFEDLARLNRVHRSTVLRWLAAIREKCLDEVRLALKEKLQVDSRQLDSLLQFAKSELEVSLSPLLKGSAL